VSTVSEKVLNALAQSGFHARAMSAAHLPEVQEDIEKLAREGLLDGQFLELYRRFLRFENDLTGYGMQIRTVFIMTRPQSLTRARFHWQGKVYDADVPPTYIGKQDEASAKQALTGVLEPAGYKNDRVRLPVKTLAVRSGLAQYGRNNITYVPGMGSFHRLMARVSDCPCEADSWTERKLMKACENCFKCGENCPTGCIPKDRFLFHAERCLTYFNEMEKPFPEGVQPVWHNALIGCMRCQEVCPVDKNQLKNIAGGPEFTERETALVLRRPPLDQLPEALKQKLVSVAMDESYDVFARNLEALIKSQDLK
jgi:epoxyqueuosine reductase